MAAPLQPATAADAAAIAAVRREAARGLVARFGPGAWGAASDTPEGVEIEIASGEVYVAREDDSVVATLRLSLRNPWLLRPDFFTPVPSPLYLTAMAVAPAWQGRGIGRRCLDACEQVIGHADAIRLDSFDAPAGASRFYEKCGFSVVQRGSYLGTPLIWLERVWRRPAGASCTQR